MHRNENAVFQGSPPVENSTIEDADKRDRPAECCAFSQSLRGWVLHFSLFYYMIGTVLEIVFPYMGKFNHVTRNSLNLFSRKWHQLVYSNFYSSVLLFFHRQRLRYSFFFFLFFTNLSKTICVTCIGCRYWHEGMQPIIHNKRLKHYF